SHVVIPARDPTVFLDEENRVFFVLAGTPRRSATWGGVARAAADAMTNAADRYRFTNRTNRCGDYRSITAGISFGGGQTEVRNIAHGTNGPVVEALVEDPAIRRLAGFMDNAFALFNPRMHAYYADTMRDLCAHNPSLQPNFQRNVFGAATFNLGPRVQTRVHTDHLNLAAGWCGIIALGDFDSTKGGHLVLWDLKLLIEFPVGLLVFIPSAILRHSNTAVAADERRMSFTQFSAGGLFRWVECGFRTQKEFV
ncbi:hypothetical protein C8Q76DRAFT_580699, partial [Earliella scabrosa]